MVVAFLQLSKVVLYSSSSLGCLGLNLDEQKFNFSLEDQELLLLFAGVDGAVGAERGILVASGDLTFDSRRRIGHS